MSEHSGEGAAISAPGLHCSFRSEDPSKFENLPQDDANTVFIPQEKGKKSSYLYSAEDLGEKCFVVHKPAHMVIEYRGGSGGAGQTKKQMNPFFLGGFQIICNARQIEVYLSNKEGKESYLMTSRGIPVGDSSLTGDIEHMHKAVSVVPGGPRAITKLHLKLLSLRPDNEVNAKLLSIKVTARLPEPNDNVKVDTNPTVTTVSNGSSLPPIQTPATPITVNTPVQSPFAPATVPTPAGPFGPLPDGILTQSDMGAAMAGMSAMARTTEDRITMKIFEMETKFTAVSNERWDRMEKHMMTLTGVVVSQKKVMEQQNQLVVRQQQMILEQSQVLKTILDQQSYIMSAMKSLQGDVHHSQQEQRGQTGQLHELLHKQQQKVMDAMKDLERAVSPIQHVLELATSSDDSLHGHHKDEPRIRDIFLQQQHHNHDQEVSNILGEVDSDNDADLEELEIGAAAALMERKLVSVTDVSTPKVGTKLSPIAEVGTSSWDTAESSVHSSDTADDKQDSAQQTDETDVVIEDNEKTSITPLLNEPSHMAIARETGVAVDDAKEPLELPGSGEDECDLEQPGHIPAQPSVASNIETEDTMKILSTYDTTIGDIPMTAERNINRKIHPDTCEAEETKQVSFTVPPARESRQENEEKKDDNASHVVLAASVNPSTPFKMRQPLKSPLLRTGTPKRSDDALELETVPSDECTPRAAFQPCNDVTDVTEKKSGVCCFVFSDVEDTIEEIGLGMTTMDDTSQLERQNKQVLGAHVAKSTTSVAEGNLLEI